MQSGNYVTRYSQLRSQGRRRIFRHAALSGLSTLSKITGRLSSLRGTDGVHCLLLHHVFEDEEDAFRNLLRLLSKNHQWASYSEAVDRILQGSIEARHMCFSFDDGFKNCLRAAEIMNEFGISACFFVCCSMIGQTGREANHPLRWQRSGQPLIELLSWDDLETLLDQGHEIGSHTMDHRNLAELSTQGLEEEICGSFELLRKKIGTIKHFAWPYGRFVHFKPLAAKIVFDAGYASCASGERGCHANKEAVPKRGLCLHRDHVIASWPTHHTLYFLARSARAPLVASDTWPPGWLEAIGGEG